ncbi:hypothetical protein SAMN04487897_13129 [Paenibacillus sp. yr247]|uniref:hypothetical protein n=1 Tax=Paenibacillus sp. yr247 TaxID=1761880 RepID=UPI0008835965|nr:hypothetical protein [Paenibacillus sp. yr247]SDP02399.1 hypothetical protein SAMN04487897_13129 [Paenibacillus sp. yr247]
MSRKINDDYIVDILTQGKDEIFEEERSLNNFRNLFNKLQSTVKEGNITQEEIRVEETSDEFPLAELLARKLDGDLKIEFTDLILNNKYIWDYKPSRVAYLFKSLNINLTEATNRIKNQLLLDLQLGRVMARSDKASNQQFKNANTEFAKKIIESKRDAFLKELEIQFK